MEELSWGAQAAERRVGRAQPARFEPGGCYVYAMLIWDLGRVQHVPTRHYM